MGTGPHYNDQLCYGYISGYIPLDVADLIQ